MALCFIPAVTGLMHAFIVTEVTRIMWSVVSYLRDRVCSIFICAGKFCLAHGLRQLTHDIKSDTRMLNFNCDITYAPP